MYSTGNSVQYLIKAKNLKKNAYIYVCVAESVCSNLQLIQPCKSTIFQSKFLEKGPVTPHFAWPWSPYAVTQGHGCTCAHGWQASG